MITAISIILGLVAMSIFIKARTFIGAEVTVTYLFWSIVWGSLVGTLFY